MVIQSISLFPEFKLWRIKGESERKHRAGGVASLILIGVVMTIMVFKMQEVFQRVTMVVKEDRRVGSKGVTANFSTFPSNKAHQTLMVAVNILSKTYLPLVTYFNGSALTTYTLQPCTVNSFRIIPNIQAVFMDLGLSSYHCLPLNINVQLGGNKLLSTSSFIEMKFTCQSVVACKDNQGIDIFLLSSFVNPNDNTQFWSPSLQASRYNYAQNIQKLVTHQYIHNTLHQNKSILPLQNLKSTTNALQLDPHIITQDRAVIANDGFVFRLITSQQYNYYNIKYLSVLDALSYIGGIFNSLLAVFFFMAFYGEAFMEFFIARLYFKSRAAKSFGFYGYLKQLAYSLLTSLNRKPDWELAEKREKLGKTIKNIMDVVYLQRRVQFLEKALTVVLERHHLKGLHLIHGTTRQEADENFKQYRFRDRLISYFRIREKYGDLDKKEQQALRRPDSLKLQEIKPKSNGSASELARKSNHLDANIQDDRPKEKDNSGSIIHKQGDPSVREEQVDIEEDYSEASDEEKEDEGLLTKEIEEQIRQDMRKLLRQASGHQADDRSRRIVEKLDKRVRQWLSTSMREEGPAISI